MKMSTDYPDGQKFLNGHVACYRAFKKFRIRSEFLPFHFNTPPS